MNETFEQKNTIIYGGAFNPPTRAHQAILQAAVDRAAEIDGDVWLLPSGERADKTIGVSMERRMGMVYALTRDVVRRNVAIHIDTTELERTADGEFKQTETCDTVREYNELYPDRHFIWVFGSDSIATMPEWKEGETMIDTLPMLVVERPGTPIERLGALANKLNVETINTSSTDVRTLIENSQPIDALVPASVLAYLNS